MHETHTDDGENSEDEYPHWRTALFGDHEHVANVWCGMKYVAWHTFHLLYVLFLAAFLAIAVPLYLGYRVLRYVALVTGGWLAARLPEGARERQVRRVRTTATTVSSTPVTRRVYGYCPVEIKMDPRWFDGLGAKLKAVEQWAKPPEYRWVCGEDCHGIARRHEPPTDTCTWCDSEYERKEVSEIEDTRL